MKPTLSSGLIAAAILGLSLGVANAHPRLLAANPAPNGRVAAPAEVRLGFSETLIERFSRIALMDGRGRPIKVGATALAPNHKQLVAPVSGKLAPGVYRVAWTAVSTDTHRVQGVYAFKVVR